MLLLYSALKWSAQALLKSDMRMGGGGKDARSAAGRAAGARRSKRVLGNKLLGLLGRFTETLCCVCLMHVVFWLYCSIYWDNEAEVAATYFWPFIDDPFGACAASGYREAWGLPCIP